MTGAVSQAAQVFRVLALVDGELRGAGWPRVLVSDRATDTEAVIPAFRAGAGGVPPAYRRAYPVADPGNMPVLHLSDREIDVLQLVADGLTNRWVGERLSGRCRP